MNTARLLKTHNQQEHARCLVRIEVEVEEEVEEEAEEAEVDDEVVAVAVLPFLVPSL